MPSRRLFLLLLPVLAGCGSPRSGPPVQLMNMGERAYAGNFTYTVTDTQWLTEIGQGPQAKVPSNRFFVVHLSVSNNGSKETLVPPTTITDDEGHSYTEINNADGVPRWLGFLRRIQPNETLQGAVVFDAPPRHYKLTVTDEAEERKAMVDLPLSFGEQQVPVMVEPKKK